jgi:2-oxoglutarate dehydrogenase E1 component
MHRSFRKPLVLMTPKSLLRHERATSSLADLTAGGFMPVLDDPAVTIPAQIERLLLCTGKVYYDLFAARQEHGLEDVALVRVEQLYPFPQQALREVLRRYRQAEEMAWVQEEPRNMGAWSFMQARLHRLLPAHQTLAYAGREEAASPATGLYRIHRREQAALIAQALALAAAEAPAVAAAAHAQPSN